MFLIRFGIVPVRRPYLLLFNNDFIDSNSMLYPCQINIAFHRAMKYELRMPDKDESRRRTYSVRLQPSVMKKLRHLAVEKEKTLSDLIEQAIEELLDKHHQTPPEDGQSRVKKSIRRSK